MDRHSNSPVLALHSVYGGYGEAEVLFDVSITIARGQCLALLGRNGMGKTTLVRTIMGQLRPSRGRIIRMGQAHPPAMQPHAIARLGFALVPEGRQIFPSLTVAEHLTAFWRKTDGGWTPDKVIQFLPALAARLKHRGGELSGGEQQMLAIGRALVLNPVLLILDEASEGLSPVMRGVLWQCLAALKSGGVAILIVDHSTPALAKLADGMCIMQKGRIVWDGATAAMSDAIAHRYLGVAHAPRYKT